LKLTVDPDFDLVPHFGDEEDYFVGNGIAGAAISSFGEVTMAIGPDYTSPSFIKSEKLNIEIDGKKYQFSPEMHRVRGCGIFYGTECIAGIRAELFDFTVDGVPCLFRKINVNNTSDAAKTVGITALVDSGEMPAEVVNGYLRIKAKAGEWCFGNKETKNWADRFCEIKFAGACGTVLNENIFTVQTDTTTLKANESCPVLLYSYHYYVRDKNVLEKVEKEQDLLLGKSFEYWKNWANTGNFRNDSSKLDDVIESCLTAVKMQQNRDGGFIAGIHKYANSYIRDSHGAHRLLIAAGHIEECKKLIQNIHTRWEIAGFIPNWWSMGSDTFIGESFNNNASEITAYYLFMIRDYLSATKDVDFIKSVFKSAKWAADAQLDFLISNNYALTFNGDETEQYVCKNDGEEYGGFPSSVYWNHKNLSFPSTVASLTSLSFFSGLLQTLGLPDKYELHLEKIRNAIDDIFYSDALHCHCWAADAKTGKPLENVMTNCSLIPLWVGARLNRDAQNVDALKMTVYRNPETGFLPNSVPDVSGFCGHSLGLLLYCMVKLSEQSKADEVFSTIMNSSLLGRWGTVSEFYGPGGVPNGHNYRCFESGILGEALLEYKRKQVSN